MKLRMYAFALLALPAFDAEACSCVPVKGTTAEQVEQSMEDATEVFTARVLRSSVGPDRERRKLVVENAHLEVLQVFKGSLRVGQIVAVYQVVSAGSCGQSSVNDPPWLFAQKKADAAPEAVRISKKWLVYAYGAEPFELSRCTRSAPLEAGGDQDVKLLRGILKRRLR